MDFTQPLRAITPTLDGPVLTALSGSEAPMTRQQVTRLVEQASEAGVRKVLSRLVQQGIVIEERIGSRYAYLANRDHLVWPAVEAILRASDSLDARIRNLVDDWAIPALSVELFGSVAQGTSTADSDIDVLLVRPELDEPDENTWETQVDELRDGIKRWTGNSCDIVALDPPALAEALVDDEPPLRSSRLSVSGVKIDEMFPNRAFAETFLVSPELKRKLRSASQSLTDAVRPTEHVTALLRKQILESLHGRPS